MQYSHKIVNKEIYIVDKLIQQRDSLLTLMEIHHNGNVSNLINKTKTNNIYQTLINKKLFKAYCELITTHYTLAELNHTGTFDWKDTDASFNSYKIYKYLFNPVIMEFIISSSNDF